MAEIELRLVEADGWGRRPYFLQGGRPLVLPNLWLEDLPRRENTLRSYCGDVLKLYKCAQAKRIDLLEGFASPKGFSRANLKSFARALCRKADGGKAGQATCQRRLQSARSFFRFAFNYFVETRDITQEDVTQIRITLEAQEARLKKYFEIEMNDAPKPETSSSFSAEELDLIWSILNPKSELNPFRRWEIRVRNFCLLNTFMPTLARRSELVLLELDDVDLGPNPTITIKQPNAVNMSKRRDGASLKTNTRVVPLPSSTAEALDHYIGEVRDCLLKPRRPCRNLFVSAKDGRRLSSQTINAICDRLNLVSEIAALGKHLHPHALRRSAADAAATLLADEADPSERNELLAYLGGWSHSSTMPAYYTRGSIQRRLNRLLRNQGRRS